jgi:hypothetical protein
MIGQLFEKAVMTILTIMVMVVLWGYVFYKSTGVVPSLYANQNFIGKIRHDFETDGYQVEIYERNLRNYGDPSLIVFAQDKNYKDQCSLKKDIKLKSPILLVAEQYENPLKVLFNSKYLREKEIVFSKLNQEGFWFYEKKFLDLDDDQDDEIVVKYLGNVCGSGTELHQIVLDNSADFNIVPTVGLPNVSYLRKCLHKDCNNIVPLSQSDVVKYNSSEVENFDVGEGRVGNISMPFTNTDHFVEFLDVDGDKKNELVFAHPELRNGECHLCPHYWIIGMYKYRNGKYYIDNKWNNGMLYRTREKISLNEGLGYIDYSGNVFGLISPYYLDSNSSSYYLLERDTSKIIDLVKKMYDK